MENPSSAYSTLIADGRVEEAEQLLLSDPAALGYQKAVNHLWRFHSFHAFETLRENLFHDFKGGRTRSWQELELLYYMQEHGLVGDPGADSRACLEEIFEAMCRMLAATPKSRSQLVDYGLVWHGRLEETNRCNLPTIADGDIRDAYAGLNELDADLMEAARLNRYREDKIVLTRDSTGATKWTPSIDPSRCAEIYIGPYYFKALDEKSRLNVRIPATFVSPFKIGLSVLMDLLMKSGWQILPLLCWRGGLAPVVRRLGSLSFSYHSHGKVDGRFHYKFGHYSDIMTVDPLGYAGYSRLAVTAWGEIVDSLKGVPPGAIRSEVAAIRRRYIDGGISWRIQPPPASEPLGRGRRTFFVPLQDPLDEVAALGHIPPRELLAAVSEGAGADDLVYVKRHPVDRSNMTTSALDEFSRDRRIRITDASIHDLFKACDTVITINSGVGFEALLAGLNVVLAGGADYHFASTTVTSARELIDVLRGNAYSTDEERRLMFLYFYFEKYSMDPSRPEQCRSNLRTLLNLQG